jgi:hypothetical protein
MEHPEIPPDLLSNVEPSPGSTIGSTTKICLQIFPGALNSLGVYPGDDYVDYTRALFLAKIYVNGQRYWEPSTGFVSDSLSGHPTNNSVTNSGHLCITPSLKPGSACTGDANQKRL